MFEDTRARGKPIVFFYGSRPFTGGLCLGVEEALSDMRAGMTLVASVYNSLFVNSFNHAPKMTSALMLKCARINLPD